MPLQAFHDVVFPIDIAYGARGGPQFSTTVLTLASGHEKRNVNWAKVRAQYNVAYGVKEPAQMTALNNFFMARWGRAYSFQYFDWRDHIIENLLLGVGNGTTRQFQIFKRYISGAYNYDRQITKIKPNTIANVTVNDVPMVLNGSGATGYTLDRLTGKVNFNTAPASGVPIVLGYVEFYVHVRFDTDMMDIQLPTYNAELWTDIILLEIKDED